MLKYFKEIIAIIVLLIIGAFALNFISDKISEKHIRGCPCGCIWMTEKDSLEYAEKVWPIIIENVDILSVKEDPFYQLPSLSSEQVIAEYFDTLSVR